MSSAQIAIEDLAALLSNSCDLAVPQSAWVSRLVSGDPLDLDDAELAELACERDPAGPVATIHAPINGLLIRHAHEPATVAALTAIQAYHLRDL